MKTERLFVLKLSLLGAVLGFIYAFVEHAIQGGLLLPLIIRTTTVGSIILFSLGVFEVAFKDSFRRKPFWFLLLTKSLAYLIMIIFWLSLINALNDRIIYGTPLLTAVYDYLKSDMLSVNIITIISIILVMNTIVQINSLHRKGELINFITGRYHKPSEKKRIFLFIDLKSSTTIAEQLGNFGFGSLLQDYYFDISVAARETNGEIYDYIGDEVIISWPLRKTQNLQNCIDCIKRIKQIISSKESNYREKYGFVPRFKAGAHSGKVVVMWVGDHKKEIMYVGDVLNTAKRIQSECDRLSTDFLISGESLERFPDLNLDIFTPAGTVLLKGKSKPVELFRMET